AAYRPVAVGAGWRHGRGVAVYDRPTIAGRTSLRLLPAGGNRVVAEVPMPETGTGAHTVVREGLARELGIEAELVEVRQVSTAALPHDDGVGGSWVTASLSEATSRAAEAFRAAGLGEPVTVVVEP